MKYSKDALTFEHQGDILISRRLIADKCFLTYWLKAVNYYRITGYLYTFREVNNDKSQAGSNFKTIWNRYTFDRRLRILMMDAIERIEVSVRIRAVYCFAHTYGKFEYTNNVYFPSLSADEHNIWLQKLINETKRCRDIFINHYQNSIRNICAHHGRLWNKELCNKPLLSCNINKYPDWHEPINLYRFTNMIFIILTILNHLLKNIAPQDNWATRFQCLLNEYYDITLKYMGGG